MDGQQINVEYFFRLLYEFLQGGKAIRIDFSWITVFLAKVWLWITYIGYALSVIALFLIVYVLVRLFQLREREEKHYNTVIGSPSAQSGENPRWSHINSLATEGSSSSLKEAIIEADIMLDDVLARAGYVGDGVGEKLKAVDAKDLISLQDAWEAHKVRNQIAHQGSQFDLSEGLAQRTLARYEAVFRELKAI